MGVLTEFTSVVVGTGLLLSAISCSIWLGWRSLLKEHSSFYSDDAADKKV